MTLLAFAILSYRQRGRLIAELHRVKNRLEGDRQVILEMIARRKPLPAIFQRIARSIAVNCPGTLSAVIRMNDGALEVAAGSSLPEAFTRDLEEFHPGAIGFDNLWSHLHAIASRHALAGCHFAPIRSGGDELLGTIAVVLRPPGGIRPGIRRRIDVPIISTMGNLAGAAIDNAWLYGRLAYQAGHDALTGLPNRLTFESTLRDAVGEARRNDSAQNGGVLAVFFLDLDRFKQINDSLGHRVGDLFLRQVARRLIPRGSRFRRNAGAHWRRRVHHLLLPRQDN